MKKKIFVFCLVTCIAVAGTVTYQATPTEQAVTQATVIPETRPLSALEDKDRANTPLTGNKATVTATTASVATPTETDFEPQNPNEDQGFQQPKDTHRDKPTLEHLDIANPTEEQASQPKNGDTRIVDGQQQGYFIGFGWVDYMGENECIYLEGMYENGNKVGSMGDINKIVGTMD